MSDPGEGQGSHQEELDDYTVQISANSSKNNATNCSKIIKDKDDIELPPPSYESVVKLSPSLSPSNTIPSTSQLPRYADVGGLSDAPPSYHSLFSEAMLRAIHPFSAEEQGSNTSHIKLSTIIINVVLFIFVASFVFLLPISMIAMGIIFVHKCPIQPRLPIYLIVLGFFQMLECCGRLAFKLFPRHSSRASETWRERYRRKDPLIYFVVVWFIIGSMWVYQTDPYCKSCTIHNKYFMVNSTEDLKLGKISANFSSSKQLPQDRGTQLRHPEGTCDKTVYAFAFWIVTSYYSVIALFFLLVLFDVVTRVVTRFCCPERANGRQNQRHPTQTHRTNWSSRPGSRTNLSNSARNQNNR